MLFNPQMEKVSREFYHNWTNSVLQHQKGKFWKNADALFRISSMTNSFQESPHRCVLSLQFSTGTFIFFEFPEIVRGVFQIENLVINHHKSDLFRRGG